MKLEIKTTLDLHFTYKDFVSAQGKSRREFARKKWVSVESLKEFITMLASTLHYNPDDAVQQFMLDIRKEIEKQ